MEHATRKLITVITEAVLERALSKDLDTLGASGYTFSDARGRGSRGVRQAGWEHGANLRLEILCDDAVAQKILTHLRAHYYDHYAMVLWVQDVGVLRPDKFT